MCWNKLKLGLFTAFACGLLAAGLGFSSARAADAPQAEGQAQSQPALPAPSDLPDVGAPPVDAGIVTGIAETAISALSGKFGWVAKLAAVLSLVMGVLRFAFKPVMLVVEAIIHATPSTADDAALEKFERGPVFKWAVWIIDWLSSVKFTTAKPANNPLVK